MRVFFVVSGSIALAGCMTPAHAGALRQGSGGSYTMSIDKGAPITLTSLDFGETNASSAGAKVKFSPVTVTTATGTEAVGEVFNACLTNKVFHQIVAVYKNAQGAPQFQVVFRNVVVESLTLPAVDKSSTPPGDMTWVFAAGGESIEPPSTGTARGPAALKI